MIKTRIAGRGLPMLAGLLAVTGFIGQAACEAVPVGKTSPAVASVRPQTIVMTDGEVDDMDSFMRFLLYTNDMDVRGIIYTSSEWHYKGDGKGTKFTTHMDFARQYHPGAYTDLRWCGTDWIHEYLEKYRSVYSKLVQHDKNYPTADKLERLVRIGNIEFEGEMVKDTEGSNFIKEVLLSADDTPIHFETWGGANTFARALKSVEDKYKGTAEWNRIYQHVSRKAILYNIMDQDDTYKNYIAIHWPDIRVYYNGMQFISLAYVWPNVVPANQQPYFRGGWMKKHILQGPLTSHYMTYGDGHKLAGDPEDRFGSMEEAKKHGYGKFDLISEGDSPSFLYLVNNGLRSVEDPAYGGWSGRLSPSASVKNLWEDNVASFDYNPSTGKKDQFYSQTRWIKDFQNDFAARVTWTQKDFKEANHAPADIKVQEGLDIKVKPGQQVTLHLSAEDPDGDALNYDWYQYEEAGTYRAPVQVKGKDRMARLQVPVNAVAGETIHVICAVTDDGQPPITRYARIILTVE